jgi:hypothetical protein
VSSFEGPAEPDEFRLHRFLNDFSALAAAGGEANLLARGQANHLQV